MMAGGKLAPEDTQLLTLIIKVRKILERIHGTALHCHRPTMPILTSPLSGRRLA